MANETRLVGLEDAIKRLKKWQIVKTQAVKDRLKKQAFKIELLAKESVPVDTGRLRASISTNWAGSGMSEGKTGGQAEAGDGAGQPQGPKELVYVVGTNVKYARRIEFGFVGEDSLGRKINQPGKPYLFPAYFSLEGDTVKAIAKILKEDITL